MIRLQMFNQIQTPNNNIVRYYKDKNGNVKKICFSEFGEVINISEEEYPLKQLKAK